MKYYDIQELLECRTFPSKSARIIQNPNNNTNKVAEVTKSFIYDLMNSNDKIGLFPHSIHPAHYDTIQQVLDKSDGVMIGYTATQECRIGVMTVQPIVIKLEKRNTKRAKTESIRIIGHMKIMKEKYSHTMIKFFSSFITSVIKSSLEDRIRESTIILSELKDKEVDTLIETFKKD